MADEEDIEEDPSKVSDPEPTAASQPSNLEETAPIELSHTSRTDTIPSMATEVTKADDRSVTEMKRSSQTSGPVTQRTSQTSNPSIQRSSQKSTASIQQSIQKSTLSLQNGKELEDTLDKLSRSQEGSKKSQEFHLNGKKSSLDQLGKDRSSEVQKSRSSRIHRQCQRGFHELIGKRELKNEELEKQQGDLRQRLNILECSMPAVMVWNIWRMSQGGSVPSLQRVLEKQFQGPASGEIYCPSTPSRHFDCRVREVEAERKQAQKRVEEARTLWTEKMAVLEEREKKLEEAKKIQEETGKRIQQLTAEAQKLRKAASTVEDDGSCQTGECGVIECKKKWLERVPSSASIKSTDLECLEKLQELAETELCMKRQIADLERREEAYMRTLQQADELWSKIEGDAASTMSALEEQLDMKTSANQQMADRICQLEDELEKMRARLVACRGELEKFMSVEKIEALIGRDDDFAEVVDEVSEAGVKVRHRMIGREDDLAGVDDKYVLSKEEMAEKDVLARPELAEVGIKVEPYTHDKDSLIREEMAEKDMLAKPDVEHMMLDIHPEDFAREQQKLDEAREYLARLGSLSALDVDDDYICPPDFACNDQVFTDTGLTEEEMTALKEKRVTAKMLLEAMTAGKEELRRAIKVEEPAEARKVEPTEVEEMMSAIWQDVSIVEEVSRELPAVVSKDTEEVEEELNVRTYTEELSSIEVDKEDGVVEDIIEEDKMRDPPVVETKPAEEVTSAVPSAVDRPQEIAVDSIDKTPDVHNILVPRNEMLKWKDDVDSIRVTIAKCPDCVVVKTGADDVAEGIAQYTDTEFKEVMEEYIPRKEEVEVVKEIAPEKSAEIEVTVEPEERAEPEIEKVEITAAEVTMELKKEEEPLAEVVAEAAPTIELTEVDEVEDKVREEYPPEPPTIPLVEDMPEKVDEVVIREMTHEPDEMKIAEEPVVEGIPVKYDEEMTIEEPELIVTEARKKEEGPAIVEEIEDVPEKVEERQAPPSVEDEEAKAEEIEIREDPVSREVWEAGAEEAAKVEVEVLPAEREKPEVMEAALPVRDEEVEVEVEVLPTIEDKVEAMDEVLPPEEERVVEAEVLPDEGGKEEIPKKDEVEVEVEMKKEMLPPAEEEVEVEVELLPVEEKGGVEERVPELEKEEIEVIEGIPEKEEVEVIEVVSDEKIEVEVDVLPEAEEVAVTETLPEEEIEVEVAVLPEMEEVLVTETALEEETEVEIDVLPEVEEAVVMEAVPEEEIEVEVVPEEEIEVEVVPEEEIEVEVVPEEEIEVEVDLLPEKEEVVEVSLPAEEEVEVDVEVLPVEEEVTVEEKEDAPEEEELEVEVEVEEVEEIAPEEVELEVDVEVLPEEVEKPILPYELEDVEPVDEAIEEVPEEVAPELLEKPVVPIEEVPEVPPEKPDEFTLFPSEEHLAPCMCMVDVSSEPSKEIEITQTEVTQTEITQTEITQLEITKLSTMQVITQTVTDVGIQTQSAQRRQRVHQPKYITITRTVDPEPEILERLTRWRKSSKERSTITTTTIGSQTEKFSYTRTFQSSRTEVQSTEVQSTEVHQSKIGVEHELRSIHYGAKVEQAEQAQCNCCMCGKTVSSSCLCPRTATEGRPPSILRLLSALPMLNKLRSPAVDQEVQHETFCPECKLRKLQEALKNQDPLKEPKQAVRKPMRDQEIDACTSSCCRRPSSLRTKQRTDQSCMVKISRLRIERTLKKDSTVDTVNEEKVMQKMTPVTEEDDDSVDCVCSVTIETGKPGVSKKVRCACGDPD